MTSSPGGGRLVGNWPAHGDLVEPVGVLAAFWRRRARSLVPPLTREENPERAAMADGVIPSAPMRPPGPASRTALRPAGSALTARPR